MSTFLKLCFLFSQIVYVYCFNTRDVWLSLGKYHMQHRVHNFWSSPEQRWLKCTVAALWSGQIFVIFMHFFLRLKIDQNRLRFPDSGSETPCFRNAEFVTEWANWKILPEKTKNYECKNMKRYWLCPNIRLRGNFFSLQLNIVR